jgi:hypothetical protein
VAPPSQLVWLNFEGGAVDYLVDEGLLSMTAGGLPAFDADEFDLAGMRQAVLNEVAERVEQIYRDAGLTEDEIAFTLNKPALGSTYCTVFFGGKTGELGLFGIAETVDRHNSVRDDKASTFTREISDFFLGDGWSSLGPLDSDPEVRFEQAVTLLANIGAHELGHILGLEHATEVVPEPNNLMGYNDWLEPQELEERNDYWYQSPGFTNEIDMLLRNIGSGTEIGQ